MNRYQDVLQKFVSFAYLFLIVESSGNLHDLDEASQRAAYAHQKLLSVSLWGKVV